MLVTTKIPWPLAVIWFICKGMCKGIYYILYMYYWIFKKLWDFTKSKLGGKND